MRSTSSLSLLLAFAAQPLFAGMKKSDQDPKLLGWTTDSRYFVHEPVEVGPDCDPSEEKCPPPAKSEAVIVDGRTGLLQKLTRDDPAYARWKKEHPLTSCSRKRRFSDGSAIAHVTLKDSGLDGEWNGDLFQYSQKDSEASEIQGTQQLALKIKRGNEVRVSGLFRHEDGGTMTGGSVEVCWSGDAHRIAWQLYKAPMTYMREAGDTQFLVGPGLGPSIRLTAGKKVLPKLVDSVGDELEKGNFFPTQALAAKHSPAVSAVLYKKGLADLAAQIAQLVPGGAKVKKMTDRSDVEIIVELADSVAKPTASSR